MDLFQQAMDDGSLTKYNQLIEWSHCCLTGTTCTVHCSLIWNPGSNQDGCFFNYGIQNSRQENPEGHSRGKILSLTASSIC